MPAGAIRWNAFRTPSACPAKRDVSVTNCWIPLTAKAPAIIPPTALNLDDNPPNVRSTFCIADRNSAKSAPILKLIEPKPAIYQSFFSGVNMPKSSANLINWNRVGLCFCFVFFAVFSHSKTAKSAGFTGRFKCGLMTMAANQRDCSQDVLKSRSTRSKYPADLFANSRGVMS